MVGRTAVDFLIGLGIGLTWTKVDDQARHSPGLRGIPGLSGPEMFRLSSSTCDHWAIPLCSPLHLHAVTPLPRSVRPTSMPSHRRRPTTTHPHGLWTTGSTLAACHCVLRWPRCHPPLMSRELVESHRPGLERSLSNGLDQEDLFVCHLPLLLAGNWSSYLLSNLRQPGMLVSSIPRGGLGRNACSAGPLPPTDPTAVRPPWRLESDQYTTDSGA